MDDAKTTIVYMLTQFIQESMQDAPRNDSSEFAFK